VERFKYRLVVVELREWSIKLYKKHVVDTRMSDIVPDGGDQKG
jgi:hypothetical protein